MARALQLLVSDDCDVGKGFFLGNPLEKIYQQRHDAPFTVEATATEGLYLRPQNIGERNYVSPRDNPKIQEMLHDQVETLAIMAVMSRWSIRSEGTNLREKPRFMTAYAIFKPKQKGSLDDYEILSATDYLQEHGMLSEEEIEPLIEFSSTQQLLTPKQVEAYMRMDLSRKRKYQESDD